MTEQGPELIFAIAGPIGIDIDVISECIGTLLKKVDYMSVEIKITKEMKAYSANVPLDEQDYYNLMISKMDYANALRKQYADNALLSRICLAAIRRERSLKTESADVFSKATAFIIRQLKRPEEVLLLRRIYGKQFVLISAYGSIEQRKSRLEMKIRQSVSPRLAPTEISHMADQLIERDSSEALDDFGQSLSDTFHLADVFVDGIHREKISEKLDRFIQALFGRCDITPSKDEYGMYAAKSASLRSADLSRQVGAAIFTDRGELITQGCNEVPKAFGGTYWDLEDPDYRDVKIGHDPNELLKRELVRDVVERLSEAEMLSSAALSLGGPAEIVKALTKKQTIAGQKKGALVDSILMDITEYGRVVHAEMCAICDAARLGRSVRDAKLYCTTFPCHNCTKHILAAGIRQVIYMEPYPKSKAKLLHENEIELDGESDERVLFRPFLGISPFRYRDIFQKGRRKSKDGTAKIWLEDKPFPQIEAVLSTTDVEAFQALISLVATIGKIPSAANDEKIQTPEGDEATGTRNHPADPKASKSSPISAKKPRKSSPPRSARHRR